MTAGEEIHEDGQYKLVMPFTVVQSAGGPLDDKAFAAGANFGALDQELRILEMYGAIPRPRFVETIMVEQIDLLAMKHGFITKATPWDEHPDEWTRIDFDYPAEDSDGDGS